MQPISCLLALVGARLVAGQDFGWIDGQLSDVISYEAIHYSQCSAYPSVCPPVTASCATTLCDNCPKYYDTCCLQSTTPMEACFQSVHDAAAGGGIAAAPTSAAAASSGGGGGSAQPGAGAASTSPMTSGAGAAGTGGSGGGSGSGSAAQKTPAPTSPQATTKSTMSTSTKSGEAENGRPNIGMAAGLLAAAAMFAA